MHCLSCLDLGLLTCERDVVLSVYPHPQRLSMRTEGMGHWERTPAIIVCSQKSRVAAGQTE